MSQVTETKPSNIVRVLQHADPSANALGLDKYGMSKIPNSMHVVQPKIDNEGRWITGIDEDSAKIRSIGDTNQRELTKERVMKLRQHYERLLGVRDLSGTSEYWETYLIDLASINLLDRTNPKHDLMYRVMMANNYIMPNSASQDTPEYWDTKFMAHNPEFEAGVNNRNREAIDKAIININLVREDRERLYMIARLCIGPVISRSMAPGVLYDKTRSWLDSNARENSDVFNKHFDMDVEDLVNLHDVREAVRYGVITYRNNQYMRGNLALGRDEMGVLKSLISNELAHEFENIKKELHNKYKQIASES